MQFILEYSTYNKKLSDSHIGWLYFIAIVYRGKLDLNSWKNDKRCGIKIEDAISDFQNIELVYVNDNIVEVNQSAYELLKRELSSENIFDAIAKCYEKTNLYKKYTYPLYKLPLDYYLEFDNIRLSEEFDSYNELEIDWINYWKQSTIKKLSAKPYIKEYNAYKIFKTFYPKQVSSKITLYRGIKSEYNPLLDKGYTSWTYDLDEAKRFATYHFTKAFTPIYADVQKILETEVELKDIVLFIGGDEKEVLLKKVKNIKVYDLKNNEI